MTPAGSASASLSTHQNLAFLRRLATDDALRAALAADPVTTLRLHGVAIDASALPSEIVLPPKGALESALSATSLEPAAWTSALTFPIPIPWMGWVAN